MTVKSNNGLNFYLVDLWLVRRRSNISVFLMILVNIIKSQLFQVSFLRLSAKSIVFGLMPYLWVSCPIFILSFSMVFQLN